MGMKKQQSFASAAWNRKGKVTRRERFLAEMDAVIPWSRLVELIAPHYPNTGKGRPPHDLERMLRIYFLQQWFNLSDPQAEDALYDSESMRRFAGIDPGEDTVPDESTILRFRHLLEHHHLTEAMFGEIRTLLEFSIDVHCDRKFSIGHFRDCLHCIFVRLRRLWSLAVVPEFFDFTHIIELGAEQVDRNAFRVHVYGSIGQYGDLHNSIRIGRGS